MLREVWRRASFGVRSVSLTIALAQVVGCTPTTDLSKDSEHFGDFGRVGTTQGSAAVVTHDERIAVISNRTDGVVSIVRLDPKQDLLHLLNEKQHTDVVFSPRKTSQPWAAVIGADDDTAFVLLRGSGEVARIEGLHSSNPHVTDTIRVGSEPTSIVISPSGKTLFVANWGEGTVSNILVAPWLEAKWDLSSRLASTSLLGPLVGKGTPATAVWSKNELELHRRPALAHPRALAITDSGDADDSDEKVYATEFFSQPLPGGGPGGPEDLDNSRQGLVYPILPTGQPPQGPDGELIQAIPIAAVPDAGFRDSDAADPYVPGCFPNQLYSAAAAGGQLLVTSVCASPSGPVETGPAGEYQNDNFKTLMHTAVFVIDTTRDEEVPERRLLLNSALDEVYADLPDAEHRMPLIPNEIVIGQPDGDGGRQAYVSSFGSSAIFPLALAADGSPTVMQQGRQFINLGESLPIGVALLSKARALVADDLKPSLALIDTATRSKVTLKDSLLSETAADTSQVVSDDVREGRRLFSTGLKVWSFGSQAFSSCEGCHPEGLSDGVTWRFSRGPRRTISLAGTYIRDDPTRRLLLWNANIDEIHDVESIARGLSGGIGGVVWNFYSSQPSKDCRLIYDGGSTAPSAAPPPECSAPLPTSQRLNGLNGSLAAAVRGSASDPKCADGDASCDIDVSHDWDHIDAFIRSVRAPHAPTTLDRQLVSDGETVFIARRCGACHAGAGGTLSRLFYTPGSEANGAIPFGKPSVADPQQLPAMLGTLRTTVYEVPGSAPSAFWPAPDALTSTFRTPSAPANATAQAVLDFIYGSPLDHQIKCVERSVGTFPPPGGSTSVVPAAEGVVGVPEVRRVLNADKTAYEDKAALGKDGFNIPSLVGLAVGAPYFHAGNARTLEELFDPAFSAHYDVFGQGPLSAQDIRALVSFLLSIDESGEHEPPSVAEVARSLGFDPDFCAQFKDARPAPEPAPAGGSANCDPTRNGVCQNAMDCPSVSSGALSKAADDCSTNCLGNQNESCVANCIVARTASTPACANCYAGFDECALMHCVAPCLSDPQGPACKACQQDSGCTEAFRTCSGLGN